MVEHTRIPFSDLVFLDDNPRTRTPEGLQQMAADIEADPTFFENRPVLVNLSEGRHQVYAGDLRAHAAHDVLHWPDIPCIVERDVPPDVMRRRAIIDNLHRETWAADILASSWGGDDLAGWGLTPDKWGDGADGATAAAEAMAAKEDDYQPPAEIMTDIVPGDLFEIGPHRLLCGDSTDSDAFAKLMNGNLAELWITDPPYGVSYADKNAFLNTISRGNHIQERIENDHLPIAEMKDFWTSVAANALIFCNDVSPYYWFACQGGDQMMMMMMMSLSDAGWKVRHELIWVKNNHVLGRCDYNYKHEPILYGWKQDGTHKFYGGFQTSVLEFDKPQKSELHPTTKPVPLISRLLENSSNENSIVLDTFLGSGTTMVAAHQLHRRCFGIEIDPKYCQVILDRMLKLDPALTITRNGKKYKPKKTAEAPAF